MGITYRDSNGNQERTEYVGAVLGTREQNLYHDSYFHAIVWDEEHQEIRSVEYGATAYYSNTGVTVDATREVIGKAVAHRAAGYLADWEAKHGATVRKGMAATVTVRGEGTLTGVVGWVGESKARTAWEARYGTPTPRYGIRVEGRAKMIFRDHGAKTLAVTVPGWTDEDRAAMIERAEDRARHDFREALRLADEREPLPAAPAPGDVVDSQEEDETGMRLYAVGESFCEDGWAQQVAAAVVDESAAEYSVMGHRADGSKMAAREVTVFRALGMVARWVENDGARVCHDGRGVVRIVREDGARLMLAPVRPVEAAQGPQEDAERPGAAVETQEAPKSAETAVEGVQGTEGDPVWVARRDEALVALRGLMDGGAGRYRRTVLTASGGRGMSDTMPTAVARTYLAEELADGGEVSKPGMGLRLVLVRENGARLELEPVRGVA
jgi:hypothetical protein